MDPLRNGKEHNENISEPLSVSWVEQIRPTITGGEIKAFRLESNREALREKATDGESFKVRKVALTRRLQEQIKMYQKQEIRTSFCQ